jgi:hypothetical protein
MENNAKLLKVKLVEALNTLQDAVEISLEIRATEQKQHEVSLLWSLFLQEFFGYIKKRSRETRQNLLAGVRFPRF